MKNNVMLEVNDIRKNYKSFILDNIGFKIVAGEIVGLVGANGAGKSTIIKAIMDLIKVDNGEVKIFGLDNKKHGEEIKERIGFVFDENHFSDELKLKDIERVLRLIYKTWDREIFQRYLKEFGLNDTQKIKELSKGMKTKFSISIALSHHAEFLIMDEPTSGLDPMVRDEILDIILNLIKDKKISILFSTHITTDLEKIANRIIFVHQGRIIEDSPMDELFNKYTIIKATNEYINKFDMVGIRKYQEYFKALIPNDQNGISDFETKIPTLEDIILYHIKREKNYV